MMNHHLTSHLLEKEIWSSQIPKPKSLHFLTLSGSIEGGTITMLVFPDQSKKPALVLRLLRDDTELPHFLNERDVLLQFQSFSPYLKYSVPKLLFCENIEGRWIMCESAVEGDPVTNFEQISIVFDWLKALANETKRSAVSGPALFKAAENTITEFQNYFTVSADEKDFFSQMLQALRACAPKNPMTYLIHGDFSRHNLFIAKTKDETALRVIDWMSARWSSFPLHDACQFLINYPLQERKEPGIKGYLKVFFDSFFVHNDFNSLAKERLISHCAAAGLDSELLPYFFGLFLMEQSILETRRILALSQKGYVPRRAIALGLSASYEQALKNQIWTEFFHFFVANRSSFFGNV